MVIRMSDHKFYYPYDIYDGNRPPKTDARSDIIEAKCLHCDGKYAIDVLVRTVGFPEGAPPIITQIRMRFIGYDACAELLLPFFKGSQSKVDQWMRTENPLLGGLSPVTMIRTGRHEKLLQFIKTSLDENVRES